MAAGWCQRGRERLPEESRHRRVPGMEETTTIHLFLEPNLPMFPQANLST